MKTFDLLNKQVKHEFYAAYLYLSMSAHFANKGLNGFSHWMRLQAQEETTHAIKLFDYLNGRGVGVKLGQIEAPKIEWNSCLDAFEDALNHEKKVTKLIHGIVESASREKDYASMNFLQWFVTEQVEEESSALEIVDKLKFLGEDKSALYMLDKELMQRQASLQE